MDSKEPITWRESYSFQMIGPIWNNSSGSCDVFTLSIPPSIIDQLNKTQKNFIWTGLNPKIKNLTINNNYENGGLKNVNIAAKISSLQISWIKRLFDKNFHDWKILSLHIMHKSLGKKFRFYSNLKVNKKLTKSFPKYCREISNTWGSKFSC